jgi:hypothetical protein
VAKSNAQMMSVVIKREIDGKVVGARSWSMSGLEADIDQFEDALSYLCNAAMDHMPKPPPQLRTVGKDGKP